MRPLPLVAGWLWLIAAATTASAQSISESILKSAEAIAANEQRGVPVPTQPPRQEVAVATGFNWRGAFAQSGLLLAAQNSLRMLQQKTRAELGGPFWADYVKSVRGLHGWSDGNPIVTNYVGHPMMGAISGFVQVQNDPRGATLAWEPANSAYWKSRFKALGWSAAYSTAFELAPVGEAGIGNVGLHPGTMAYVDLVVTPLAGFGMLLLEDYLDRAVISKLERNGVTKKARVVRVLLNPQRSLANVLRFELPSHRDSRPFDR